MTTGATSLLSLALPVEGELDGTWGDVVNFGITDYVDIAVAGTLTLTGDGAVTLLNTTGDVLGTNITSSLTGAGNATAQFAVVKIDGTLTATKVVTVGSSGSAPRSKTYVIDNTTATYGVTFKAYGQTGVTVAAGEKCTVYYNGTDFVKVSTITVDGVSTVSFGTTGLTPNTATSGAVTVAGTLNVANGGTGVTTSTGSGSVVLSTSPTLVTPVLGTPQSATLTNATGLPISTGVSGLGTGIATALASNVGSAGAPVINGGALGTPSSGTLTNATGLPLSTGISGLGTGIATALATNVGSAGAPVVNGGALGTPSSGTLTNATGLPLSTGITGLGTNVATFLATPTSANLAAALTDETGTGANVFANSPTLVTPILGTPSSATLTNATGLPLTTGVTGILPVANGGTGASTANLTAGSGVTITGTWPNQTIAATGSGGTITSVTATSPLASSGGTTPNISLSSTTGTGAVVLAASPALTGTPTVPTAANGTNTTQAASTAFVINQIGAISSGVTTFSAGTTGLTPSLATSGAVTLGGTLAVANGGTGTTTATGTGNLVLATSPTLVTPILGTPQSGNFSGGSFTWPTFNQNTTGTAAGLSVTLPVGQGGTGVTTSTGSGNNVLSTSPTLVTPILGTPQSGNFSTGTFTWPTFNQNTTGTAGGLSVILDVAHGGTGVTSATGTGSVVLSNSPTLVTPVLGTPASATLTNATGLPISTGVSGLGTGVATALAVNVGSAGAPVINGGALGTPASGDLANCTFPTLNQNTTGTAASTPKLLTTNFTIEESGGNLIFKYGATTIASMTSAGVFTTLSDINGNGTP